MSNNKNKGKKVVEDNGGIKAIDARKRLLKDLKEINEHPLENITAAPVEDSNIFLWHANLRGVDNMKEIFHAILEFPSTYPLNPPVVSLCSPLPHPNVFPSNTNKGLYSLCMDMLEQGAWNEDIDKNVQYSGWSSSYSVQLILIQLQSFLLDAQLQYATQKGSLTEALEKAKNFQCSSCSHSPKNIFPPFASSQQLGVKTMVKVHRFVPRPRAAHLYPPQPPRLFKKPAFSSAVKTTTTPTTNKQEPTKKDTTTAETKKDTTTTTTTTTNETSPQANEATPQVPVRAEWTVVKSRRANYKPLKITHKKPKVAIAAPKVVKPVKPVKVVKPASPPPKNQSPAPSVSKAKKAPSKAQQKSEPEVVVNTESSYKKDYVKMMLEEADKREKMLRQRQNEKNSEAQQEARIEKRRRAREVKKAKLLAKKAAEKAKLQEEVSPAEPQETKKTQETKGWKEEKKGSKWADEVDDQPAPSSSSKRAKKTDSSSLSIQQLQEKVVIDHDKLGSLSYLPLDILVHSFSFLTTKDVAQVSQVSVDMHKVAENGVLWKELFSRFYPKSTLSASNIADWKFVFMREVDHIMDELQCFHTKHNFEEDVLGIPINFSVNPKTEKISSTLEILSSTAFNKHNIRKSAFKQPFTHFLPLYITEDHFQRALPEIKKLLVTLSPEYRTTGFAPRMALTVFPKLMNTMIVLVMDGGLQASVKALNGYFAFHRLLLAFVELYPELMTEVNNSISDFIKSEDNRTKSVVSSMGDWLPFISISNKYNWAHVAKAVVGETFDRNVIWICKEDPTLATLADINKANANNNSAKPGVEQHRLDKSFEASCVSKKLLLFHVYFITRIARPPGVSLAQVADNYDRFLGRPNSKTMDAFQNAVKRIQAIKNWPDFFYLVGLPCPSPAALTTILRESVRNSKRKKYHSDTTNFRNIHASGTSVILKKGDNFSAPSSLEKVIMGLGWGYSGDSPKFLDASCFEFKRDGSLISFVDYANNFSPNLSATHSGDVVDYTKKTVEHTIAISLSGLPKETEVLMFTITAFTGTLKDGLLPWVRLSDGASNQELCRYVLENTGTHTAVMMCMMTKNVIKRCWDLKVLGKLDEGRASSYSPLKNNMSSFLASGVAYKHETNWESMKCTNSCCSKKTLPTSTPTLLQNLTESEEESEESGGESESEEEIVELKQQNITQENEKQTILQENQTITQQNKQPNTPSRLIPTLGALFSFFVFLLSSYYYLLL